MTALLRFMLSRLVVLALLTVFFSPAVWAKDPPITAVMLFDGPAGPAYVQISGFLVNGKTELRVCGMPGPADKSVYKNMAKLSLTAVRSLERGANGTLVAETATAPAVCVVPGNFKYEKDGGFTTADLVDKSVFSGVVLGSAPAGMKEIPAFKPHSKIYFVSATDLEAAEYLRASYAASIPLLQTYFAAYPSGPHAAGARMQLAQLLDADGVEKLAAYKKTAGSASPDFAALKAARQSAEAALVSVPADGPALTLNAGIQSELKELVRKAAADLDEYKKALKGKTAGYPKLVQAAALSQSVTLVDAKYVPGQALQNDVAAQTHALDTAVQSARIQLKAQQYKDALTAIQPYRAFVGENADVTEIVTQIYQFHFAAANVDITQAKWTEAVSELELANSISATAEAKDKLAEARKGLLDAQNKAAAASAVSRSDAFTADKDPIHAYEVLADLDPAPRALVAEQMAALEVTYLGAATARAKQLQSTHSPIRGRADEDAMRQAYEYYRRASLLSDDEDFKIKLDLLGTEISAYYVAMGRKYMEKPLASEVGIGWAYLEEALQYKNNLEEVSDEKTKNTAAYRMRAQLSIEVQFRDGTSRRDSASAGFSDQMQQAMATGLESSGLPVRVILPNAIGPVEPNYKIVGEILEHRPIRTQKKTTLQSEYRSGAREIPNAEWNKADQEYEADMLELQRNQSALTVAQAHNNKKQIEVAEKALSDTEEKTQVARSKMNALPRTTSEAILSPYSYTKNSLELINDVKLSFRIVDWKGNLIQSPTPIAKGEKPRTFVILEGIKSEDTKGLKEEDSPPDEAQLMTDVELEARDTMVNQARDMVLEMPKKILAQARSLSSSGDLDAAGEMYVLYLNSTTAEKTTERLEASSFLSDKFNIRHASTLSASLQR